MQIANRLNSNTPLWQSFLNSALQFRPSRRPTNNCERAREFGHASVLWKHYAELTDLWIKTLW